MSNPPYPYPCTVRRSARARHVRLIVSHEGLVVVVPEKFHVAELDAILESKRDWIRKALEKIERAAVPKEPLAVPATVALQAIGERWTVETGPSGRERLVEVPGSLFLAPDFNTNEALAALRQWLLAKGRLHLPRLLREEAERYGFHFVGVVVKEQKSLWGSCSSKGNINLNARLLFLPPELVRHVVLHELCHLREMNHSQAFRALLSRFDPHADRHILELKDAWEKIPRWAL